MRLKLSEGLERIGERVDTAHLRRAEELQRGAWNWEPVPRVPCLLLDVQPPEWPLFPYREAFDNPEKMLWNELLQAYVGVQLRDDRMLAVRPHFGSGTLASLFGARMLRVDNQLAWVEPLHSSEAVRALVRRGIPEFSTGFGPKVGQTLRVYREYLAALPDVHIFLCDTQGPLDTALLLWGTEMYVAMREEPALVHAVLDLVTETTIASTRWQKGIVSEPDNSIYHFWYSVPGGVRVVDDVAMNLSPEMYAEFGRPYNQRVLAAFGGGYMHYCGHVLKTQDLRLRTPGLRGIEMGFDNPTRSASYTLERIWYEACARRVAIVWVAEEFPRTRPAISTGLIYGCKLPVVAWEDAPAALARLQRFWSNPFEETE